MDVLLKTVFYYLACSLVAVSAMAAGPVEIAPGVHLLRGELVPGRQPDGNSVIFTAPAGLIVVDTGRHVAHTRALLDFAAARKQPIVAAVNTHWHLDHTGGNVLLRREVPAVKIYASSAIDDALKTFLANYAKQLRQAIAGTTGEEQQRHRTELALLESGKQLAPDVVIARSGARKIAGRALQVNLETSAATKGDLWIVDTRSGTLVAGDLVTLPVPFLDTADPQGWQDALGRIAATKFERLVPGHGPVLTRAELERYTSAYRNLLACGASTRTDCASQWLTDTGTLVAERDREFAGQAVNYYLDAVLRKKWRYRRAPRLTRCSAGAICKRRDAVRLGRKRGASAPGAANGPLPASHRSCAADRFNGRVQTRCAAHRKRQNHHQRRRVQIAFEWPPDQRRRVFRIRGVV